MWSTWEQVAVIEKKHKKIPNKKDKRSIAKSFDDQNVLLQSCPEFGGYIFANVFLNFVGKMGMF